MTLLDYIRTESDRCVRTHTADEGDLIGLPKPYSVPCAADAFQELYYWDTYFTNLGLLALGRIEQARNNIDDILYLIDRFGYMPNGNRTFFLRNTQPPFSSRMVRIQYEAEQDLTWLARAYPILEKEYAFWQTKRMTPTGLNRYFGNVADADEETLSLYYRMYLNRTCRPADAARKAILARHSLICCESGWDYSPRFSDHGQDYLPVDLNALLYDFECNMAYFASLLHQSGEFWLAAAQKRQALITRYLYNPARNAFQDYDYVNGRFSAYDSAAAFFPLAMGVASNEQARATAQMLTLLETNEGIAACADQAAEGSYQWAWPNGWAPLNQIAVEGLARYGYTDDAARIAHKWCCLMERTFARTGQLWEKYNVVDPLAAPSQEEGTMPPMLGWTAGVYLNLRTQYPSVLKGAPHA